MPHVQTESADLRAQYAAQVATDLERNTADQQLVNAELALLQDKLRDLQRDHAVLEGVRQALDHAGRTHVNVEAPGRPEASTPRQTASRPRAKEPAPKGVPAKAKPATVKSPGRTTQAAGPTLGKLIRAYLAEQHEPRSAAEITAALAAAHPERSIKATVVRTTAENLVAKSLAERAKQGASVFYTATSVGTANLDGPKPAAGETTD
ncbi:hypothetical protein GCM10023205_81720 [Yinghuangia aomiensis]|uniref:Regulatory protein n=1 Tax=Yinghuangia aomiensis TaxID=676205 RepID=A0ABP9IEV5_9ACTN